MGILHNPSKERHILTLPSSLFPTSSEKYFVLKTVQEIQEGQPLRIGNIYTLGLRYPSQFS